MGVLPSTDNPDEGIGAGFGSIEAPVDRTGFFENVSAGYRASQAGPGTTRSRQNAHEVELYNQVIAALTAEGELGADRIAVRPGGVGYRGPKDIPVNQFGIGYVETKRRFRNPYTAKPSLSQADNPLARLYLGGDLEEKSAIWAAVERVRKRNPGFLKDLPDEATLVKRAVDSRNRQRESAEAVMSRAGALGKVGGFIGGVAGSLAAGDPENAVGFGVTGAASKTLARTVIKNGLQEGTIGAGVGVISLPSVSADADRLGDEMTAGDMVRSVAEQGAVSFALGMAAPLAGPTAGKAKELGGKAVEAVTDKIASVSPATRDAMVAVSLRAGTVKERDMLGEFRRLRSPYSVHDTSTPDERAAINVMERDVEVREASPLHPEADPDHESRLGAIAEALGVNLPPETLPTTAPVQQPSIKDRKGRRPASYTDAVHQAEGTGKNPRSSADGHFQFTEGTWLEYAPKVTNTSGMSRAQILGLRKDRGIATRAEQMFRADNARYLRNRGIEDSAGNLSLAHFLGRHDAAKVLAADPSTPVSQLVDAASIRANPEVFGKNNTAGKIITWAQKRIGSTITEPPARPDAVPAADYADEMDYAAVRPYGARTFKPDELTTDAALMQYKSGGDEAGVTEKLSQVTAWNPMLSSEILVWEGLDGRNVVVDGHQRTGLAKRLSADDPSIQVPAVVIREADGITAQQARVLGALRNINLGTGSLLDNARVLRDAPSGAGMLIGAENRRPIEGLARLSHEAFGAAVNHVIDPQIAARIGNLAGHAPDTHMALVDLLLKNRIHNPREAQAVIRQAQADGFGRPEAEQLAMFGAPPEQSLYVPISRILLAAQKRLKDDKRTFANLSERAGKIEEAGNVLDRAANQGRVGSAAEAIAILDATAHRSGPVRDALIAAARAELSGTRRADAAAQFLRDLEGIDLRSAAEGVERDGRSGEPSGEAGSGDAVPPQDGELPDSLEPSRFDQAVDTAAKAEVFSDPVGEGAKAQTALIDHDLRMAGVPYIDPAILQKINGGDAIDPNILERQRQEAKLKADAPMRSTEDQEGTMGLALFDAADQPSFRLDEEGDARPLGDIMGEADADEAAAANARACLQPPKVTE